MPVFPDYCVFSLLSRRRTPACWMSLLTATSYRSVGNTSICSYVYESSQPRIRYCVKGSRRLQTEKLKSFFLRSPFSFSSGCQKLQFGQVSGCKHGKDWSKFSLFEIISHKVERYLQCTSSMMLWCEVSVNSLVPGSCKSGVDFTDWF